MARTVLKTPPGRTRHGARTPRQSIAVMPFDNLSGAPAQDHLADAFPEALIADPSRIGDAFVIARRSSFTCKNRDVDVAQVADGWNLRYALQPAPDRRQSAHHRATDRRQDQSPHLVAARRTAPHRGVLGSVRGDWADRPGAQDGAVRGRFGASGPAPKPEGMGSHAEGQRGTGAARPGFPRGTGASAQGDLARPRYRLGLERAVFRAFLRGVSGIWPGSRFRTRQPFRWNVRNVPSRRTRRTRKVNGWLGVGHGCNGRTERARAACGEAMALNPKNDCGYVCAGLCRMAAGDPRAAIPFVEHSLRLNRRFRTFTKHEFMGIAHVQAEFRPKMKQRRSGCSTNRWRRPSTMRWRI